MRRSLYINIGVRYPIQIGNFVRVDGVEISEPKVSGELLPETAFESGVLEKLLEELGEVPAHGDICD